MFRKKLRELLRLNKKNRISTKDKVRLVEKLLELENGASMRMSDSLQTNYKKVIKLISED